MFKIKNAHPTFTGILVTADKYDKDEVVNGVINKSTMKGNIKMYQKVFRVGPFVKQMKEGDIVKINLGRYAIHMFEENSVKKDLMEDRIVRYNIPTETINGVEYMHIQENDIVLVIDEYEEIDTPDQNGILTVTPEIITLN